MTYQERFNKIISRLKNIKRVDTKGSMDYYTYLTISTDKTEEESEIVDKIYNLKKDIERLDKVTGVQKSRKEKNVNKTIEDIEKFLSDKEYKYEN